jgi:predicted component of type VI protein secretion system
MNETVIPAEDLECDVREALVVRKWRAEQLRRLGLPSLLAATLADDVDWHALSALIERGCPLGLALEIVR